MKRTQKTKDNTVEQNADALGLLIAEAADLAEKGGDTRTAAWFRKFLRPENETTADPRKAGGTKK